MVRTGSTCLKYPWIPNSTSKVYIHKALCKYYNNNNNIQEADIYKDTEERRNCWIIIIITNVQYSLYLFIKLVLLGWYYIYVNNVYTKRQDTTNEYDSTIHRNVILHCLVNSCYWHINKWNKNKHK